VVGGIGTIATILFTVGFLFPLKLLVAFLQAFIFCMLSMLYIAGALESEHGSEHGHGAPGDRGDHAGHDGPGAVAPAHH
jgi:hypothetical protein